MKSVGEAMAIGRNFTEALQKALRSLEQAGSSFRWDGAIGDKSDLIEKSKRPTDGRIVTVQQAIRAGATVDELYEATRIDRWFLDQMLQIVEERDRLAEIGFDAMTRRDWRHAKRMGFGAPLKPTPIGRDTPVRQQSGVSIGTARCLPTARRTGKNGGRACSSREMRVGSAVAAEQTPCSIGLLLPREKRANAPAHRFHGRDKRPDASRRQQIERTRIAPQRCRIERRERIINESRYQRTWPIRPVAV